VAHPSRADCREERPVTARKRTLVLSRSLAARARAPIAELDQEIERLQRTERKRLSSPPVRRASATAAASSRSWRGEAPVSSPRQWRCGLTWPERTSRSVSVKNADNPWFFPESATGSRGAVRPGAARWSAVGSSCPAALLHPLRGSKSMPPSSCERGRDRRDELASRIPEPIAISSPTLIQISLTWISGNNMRLLA
jgi:hypothetical protein